MTKFFSCLFFSFYAIVAAASEEPKAFDKALGDLLLGNTQSGQDHLKTLGTNCGDIMLAWCFSIKQGTLQLTQHPGDEAYAINEIEVNSQTNNYPLYSQNNLVTNKGIEIGLNRKQVTDILGEPDSTSQNSIHYRLEEDDFILENYNLPIYYGDYYFQDDKLVRFKFGFENP